MFQPKNTPMQDFSEPSRSTQLHSPQFHKGSAQRPPQSSQGNIFNTPNLQRQVQQRSQPQSKKRGLAELQNEQHFLSNRTKIKSEFELDKIYRPDFDLSNSEMDQQMMDYSTREPEIGTFKQFMETKLNQTQADTQDSIIQQEANHDRTRSFLQHLIQAGSVLGKQNRQPCDGTESLLSQRQQFAEIKQRETQKEQEEKALELLDQVDPLCALEKGSNFTKMQLNKEVRMHFQFHPYLLYKAGHSTINEPSDCEKASFGGFFPASIGISVAYIVSGTKIKVWDTERSESARDTMSFDQVITAVVLMPPDPKTLLPDDPNCKRLFRLLVHTCVRIETVYLQEEPFKLLPSDMSDQSLVISTPTTDCIFLNRHQRVWMGADTTHELILEQKPPTFFSAKRNTLKLNKPNDSQTAGQKLMATALSLFARQRYEVKSLHELPELGLAAALMQETDGEKPVTTIELYDITTLRLAYRVKLERVLAQANTFLQLHKAHGNVSIGTIDIKSKKISFLSLAERIFKGDAQRLGYLSIILTNGVKLQYEIQRDAYGKDMSRFLTDDDFRLVAVESSPIEIALEQYLSRSTAGSGPLLTSFHPHGPVLPFHIDYNLGPLNIIDYKSFKQTEVFVVECEDRLHLVSVLQTISNDYITTVRPLQSVPEQKNKGYLGMSISKSKDQSISIKVLTQAGQIQFKQQTIKDQIGQYLFIESNQKRLKPQAREEFKAHMSQFLIEQNPYDLLTHLLGLIIFTHSAGASPQEQLSLPVQPVSQIYAQIDSNMDKRRLNACAVQKSSIAEGYYQRLSFDSGFDNDCVAQHEQSERIELLKMDEDMQKLAIKHFIDIVAELETRCGHLNQEKTSQRTEIVSEIILTQLRRSVGPILQYQPFSSSQTNRLEPEKLENVFQVFKNLAKFLPKLAKKQTQEIKDILVLTNRMIQGLNLYLVINKSFGIELNLETLKKERVSKEVVEELESLTFKDYFERGLQSPSLCELIEVFIQEMHSLETRRSSERHTLIKINTRLNDEIKSKCCPDFLTASFLDIVQGLYLFKVAGGLHQRQKQLFDINEKQLNSDLHPCNPRSFYQLQAFERAREQASLGHRECEIADQKLRALQEGCRLVMANIKNTDIGSVVTELLKNSATEHAINYCLAKARSIKTIQSYLETRQGNTAQKQTKLQNLEIVRQDCFTIVIELLEEALLVIAHLTQKQQSQDGHSQTQISKETIEERLGCESQFEGVNHYRRQLQESDDIATIHLVKSRICEIVQATDEKHLHFQMFKLLIDYGETAEFETMKSAYLEEFIQKNVIELYDKLGKEQEDAKEGAVDMKGFENNIAVVYRKLTAFNQHEQCLKFLLAQLTDRFWYKDGPESARRFGINERIDWLMKAKVCLAKAQPSPFIQQSQKLLTRLIKHLQTQAIIWNKIYKVADKMEEDEVSKKFGHFLEKMTFGICSEDLLLQVCRDNKLWSAIPRAISLKLDSNNQVICDHSMLGGQQGARRQEITRELQKMVDSAMESYVQEKYSLASKSEAGIRKFRESLVRKQGVFAAHQDNQMLLSVLNDAHSKTHVDLFPYEILVSKVFEIDNQSFEDRRKHKAFLKNMASTGNRSQQTGSADLIRDDWVAEMLFDLCFQKPSNANIFEYEEVSIGKKEIHQITRVINAFISVFALYTFQIYILNKNAVECFLKVPQFSFQSKYPSELQSEPFKN